MKRFVVAVGCCGALFASAVPADAAQGCGRGFHRGFYGRCVPNWNRHRWHRWW